MRIQILVLILHTDLDPAFHFDEDLVPDPDAQYVAQIHAEPERW
jgi:hypothetical protein